MSHFQLETVFKHLFIKVSKYLLYYLFFSYVVMFFVLCVSMFINVKIEDHLAILVSLHRPLTCLVQIPLSSTL